MLSGFYWKLKLKTDQNASRKDSVFLYLIKTLTKLSLFLSVFWLFAGQRLNCLKS